jgi:hypothetical protein
LESRTPQSSKVKQQAQKPNESEYDSTYLPPSHDQQLRSKIDSDDESTSPRHQSQQHQITLENIDQGTWRPLYNRYRIIAGDFELTESPSDNSANPNESNSGQMQLVFKAVLQGHKVQERAENSIHEFGANGNRTQTISSAINPTNFSRASYPNSRQSPINEDRQNQNAASHQGGTYQTRSTPERRNRDHDKPTNIEHDPSRQSSSPPSASRKRQSHRDHSSMIDSNQHSNDQLPLDDHPAPSNRNSHTQNDDDLDGIHERSRSSSQNRKSPKNYEQSPLKRTDHSRSSPLLTSPKASPTSLESKTKYFFGENVQNPVSDEDSDEADCEMFGHNSQPKPLTNTTARRNLDYPSEAISRVPLQANNNSENPQFGQQTDVGITTENSLLKQQYSAPSSNQSTVRNTGDSLQHSQRYSPNQQTSSQANQKTPAAYSATTNMSLNQNFSNETSSTTGFPQQHPAESDHYEQNLVSHIRPQQSATSFPGRSSDDKESPDEDDDPDRDNHDAVEYEENDDDIHDRMHDNREDRTYMNEVVDYEDDNLPRDDDSPHTSVPPSSGVSALIQQYPVRDVPTSYQPIQYPASPPQMLSRPGIDNTEKTNKKGGLFGFFSSNKSKDVDKNKPKSTQKKPTKTRDTSSSRATSKR